jgi:hypothetical protein
MQKWMRIGEYAKEYQKHVYKYYASHSHQAYLCTYYNLDLKNSIYDGNILDAGYYTKTGDKSGLRWRKILFLPVYNIEQIQAPFNSDERGNTKAELQTSFNFPTQYEIQPYPHDFVMFEQNVLKPVDNHYPMYEVKNVEKATNTDITFWKVSLENTYRKEPDLDPHISSRHVFFDYSKRIYDIEMGMFLYRLLEKNRNLDYLNDYFSKLSGFYIGR